MPTALETTTPTEMVKLDLTNNWTGLDELPFEPIAERVLEMEVDDPNGSGKGALTVEFGKPTWVEGQGFACVFRMTAMGRTHISPARGIDPVQALQAAFTMVGRQLTGMGRQHRITFLGGDDLGFVPASSAQPQAAAGCPVMGGAMKIS